MKQFKATRVSAEASQRQYVDIMHHPAKFSGKCSPDETDQWFRDMERIFHAKRCSDENRLAFSEYLLTGETSHWWSSMRMLLEGSGTPISWEVFKHKFYTEYFSDSVRFAKEVEFLQLVQGNMLVLEYADQFKHLLRFHTLRMNEEGQCMKFDNGLRGDIKLLVTSLSIKEFPALVEKARVLEKTKMEVESHQRQPPRVGGPNISRGQQGSISCYNCGGPHVKSVCPQLREYKRCNRCGREGHYERDCPLGRREVVQNHSVGRFQPRGGVRPQTIGRVYAMSRVEAASSAKLIISQCLLYRRDCVVLFDSGATHSFVSDACVERLGLTVGELQCDLVVSTPTTGLVRTSLVCARYPVEVEGRRFKVNLIYLPLQGLEVIIGMDWLSTNHILIDCGEKKLVFPKKGEVVPISSGQLK
ncbi:uncharacterized protein LOC108324592 [Vigna angularis]|uniref:uncharacterized protein LOC108324592 n=1 Tax=Phaseolus angularis TaxID=3914 RepID=UPI000809DA0B|nr:uncharacterized protein LOC108324592 [Vigna angularis]